VRQVAKTCLPQPSDLAVERLAMPDQGAWETSQSRQHVMGECNPAVCLLCECEAVAVGVCRTAEDEAGGRVDMVPWLARR
jgi:hypothetical protein